LPTFRIAREGGAAEIAWSAGDGKSASRHGRVRPASASERLYGIYFDFNSDKIKPESKQVLDEIAQALNDNPDWKLTVDGHTDNIGGVPTTSTFRNAVLSR
jgi:outer membrane protein OmpA-like peptidoglycan-associated protein